MKIIPINPNNFTGSEIKKINLYSIDGNFYVQLEDYPDMNSVVEMCLQLAKENENLRERIQLLQELLDQEKKQNFSNS